jgi:predicted regulator of Ras-like GTPase activity (Roadblock/LC7/MglB family)
LKAALEALAALPGAGGVVLVSDEGLILGSASKSPEGAAGLELVAAELAALSCRLSPLLSELGEEPLLRYTAGSRSHELLALRLAGATLVLWVERGRDERLAQIELARRADDVERWLAQLAES